MPYDPFVKLKRIQRIVCKGIKRKYYRFRPGKWYGGIATADCCGCILKCIFCWSDYPRDNPDKVGKFYSPESVFKKLYSIALANRYSLVRVSGNEPTVHKQHLIELIRLFDEKTDLTFMLETSGIILGNDEGFVRQLSNFKNLHVRVSLKGANHEEFQTLTGADGKFFEYQLKSLELLEKYEISYHPALMISFSTKRSLRYLVERLYEINKELPQRLETEVVILYPHVIERLRSKHLRVTVAVTKDGKIIKDRQF